MLSRTGVRCDGENVVAAICHECVADGGDDFAEGCARVWHGHVLCEIVGVECPQVYDLGPMRVDEA